MKREVVGDQLDQWIAEEAAKDPEFEEMLDAAIRVRQLMQVLADARERAGLTQTDVARRMGTTQPAVARLEAGGSDPRLTTVERYAEAVGLRLSTSPA